jgi:hypothetical protein
MIKILLSASIIINLILGFLLYQQMNRPPLERIIVEHTPPKAVIKKISKKVVVKGQTPSDQNQSISNQEDSEDLYDPESSRLFEEVGEKVVQDRLAYLTGKLNLTQSDLDQIEKIKESYFKKLHQIIALESNGELGIDQRRQMLDLETERDREIETLMGKDKWETFKKYKKSYNQKKFEEQSSDYGIVVPMDI